MRHSKKQLKRAEYILQREISSSTRVRVALDNFKYCIERLTEFRGKCPSHVRHEITQSGRGEALLCVRIGIGVD